MINMFGIILKNYERTKNIIDKIFNKNSFAKIKIKGDL